MAFAISVLRLIERLPQTPAGSVVSRQLAKSATSVGANYRAVCSARSRADFIAKTRQALREKIGQIVAVGGGFAYGALGATHHATEDLAILRALPGMTVVAPGDPVEAALATRAVAERPGPCYLRLGRAGEPTVHAGPIEFSLGRAVTVREGGDLTLISTGAMLETAVRVAERLAGLGVQARVLSFHTLKPLDTDAVLAAAAETLAVVTLEEHSVIGGLGSAVAVVLAEQSEVKVPFKMIGLPSAFASQTGSQAFMRDREGLSPDAICATLNSFLKAAGGEHRV